MATHSSAYSFENKLASLESRYARLQHHAFELLIHLFAAKTYKHALKSRNLGQMGILFGPHVSCGNVGLSAVRNAYPMNTLKPWAIGIQGVSPPIWPSLWLLAGPSALCQSEDR